MWIYVPPQPLSKLKAPPPPRAVPLRPTLCKIWLFYAKYG